MKAVTSSDRLKFWGLNNCLYGISLALESFYSNKNFTGTQFQLGNPSLYMCRDLLWIFKIPVLTGPRDSDSMASSHSFLFGWSFLMMDFCCWESLYASTLIFLGDFAGEVLAESRKKKKSQ